MLEIFIRPFSRHTDRLALHDRTARRRHVCATHARRAARDAIHDGWHAQDDRRGGQGDRQSKPDRVDGRGDGQGMDPCKRLQVAIVTAALARLPAVCARRIYNRF